MWPTLFVKRDCFFKLKLKKCQDAPDQLTIAEVFYNINYENVNYSVKNLTVD